MSTSIQALSQAGQSLWLDFIRRGFVTSGALARYVHDGWITGLTSNPTIFAKAISGSTDYDDALHAIAATGAAEPLDVFVRLAVDDMRLAADVLRPVYDRTDRADGYVSLEVPPGLENDHAGTVAEATRLFQMVDRPNLMIKVPGTQAGVRALEDLIAEGINVNVTLLFSVAVYEQVAQAYLAGLEQRLEARQPLAGIAGVASFFVSRVDTAVDAQLPEDSPLRGTAAIANARFAYRRYRDLFSGRRWENLASAGARLQRPLWASTSTKNKVYPDLLYVDGLIAPDTVNTVPETTLLAFVDHGRVDPRAVDGSLDGAAQTLDALRAAGVDLGATTDRLLREGLASFAADFEGLLSCIGDSLTALPAGKPRHSARLADLAPRVETRLQALEQQEVVHRLWAGDYTLWKLEPREIPDRLGWITVVDEMMDEVPDLQRLAQEVAGEGFDTAVLLGMGGSSLAPEVLQATCGVAPGALRLEILDTTLPASIRALEQRIDLARTLFIVASKSGATIETLSHLAHFWNIVPDGSHFIAITDPGTSLEHEARARKFRRVFLNRSDIGGRYSAISYFGMVPAALIGADVGHLLDQAHEMLHACHPCVSIHDNPGAWLGAIIGTAALFGRDKLTFVLPQPIATFGTWAEQLIAESTGKEGTGILPVEGEPLGAPEVYGDDRLFVAVGDHEGLEALAAAGHPVVRLPYSEPGQIGGGFIRWAFATAVAGYLLSIDPFDQPNVQEAKDATARILKEGAAVPETPALADLLNQVRLGDYVAILAYLPRRPEVDVHLQAVRLALRDRLRVATTVGYGPRFLHSTGQYHKGGRNNGIFIQVVEEGGVDVPIPGQPYTFGELSRAQALGDLESLRAHDRQVARVTLAQLQELIQ